MFRRRKNVQMLGKTRAPGGCSEGHLLILKIQIFMAADRVYSMPVMGVCVCVCVCVCGRNTHIYIRYYYCHSCLIYKTWRETLFFFLSFVFLGPHSWHTKVPRLGIDWLKDAAAGLHHNSWQRWILNPLSTARDQTRILMDASQICFPWATTGTPSITVLLQMTCWSFK